MLCVQGDLHNSCCGYHMRSGKWILWWSWGLIKWLAPCPTSERKYIFSGEERYGMINFP